MGDEEDKGILKQASHAYTSSGRGRAQTSTPPSLSRWFSAGHSESFTKGYIGVSNQLFHRNRGLGALPFRAGTESAGPACRRSDFAVQRRTGSDDHRLLLDASGSASRGDGVWRRCPGKGREQGGATGGGGLTGRGPGPGRGLHGGAGFGGGCFHSRPRVPSSSAGAARRGGVSGSRTDACGRS